MNAVVRSWKCSQSRTAMAESTSSVLSAGAKDVSQDDLSRGGFCQFNFSYFCFRDALRGVILPDGSGSPGARTFGRECALRKISRIECDEKIRIASLCTSTKWLISGVSEMLPFVPGESNSASSLSRLMSAPIVSRRTFNRRSTALYSDRISSESSHVNVARSIQSRESWVLGFEDETMPERKPEIPATRTEVSTTPLRPS